MKHLNNKIGMIGQKMVCNYLKENKINYWTNFDDNYNITDIVMQKDNRISFIEVSTKQHTIKNGFKVTGKNKKQIEGYLRRQFKYNIDYFIIFVDIKERAIYGNNLNNLMRGTKYANTEFPLNINCGGQEITFFSLNDLIPLAKMKDADADELSKMVFKNKHNKYQTSIL